MCNSFSRPAMVSLASVTFLLMVGSVTSRTASGFRLVIKCSQFCFLSGLRSFSVFHKTSLSFPITFSVVVFGTGWSSSKSRYIWLPCHVRQRPILLHSPVGTQKHNHVPKRLLPSRMTWYNWPFILSYRDCSRISQTAVC